MGFKKTLYIWMKATFQALPIVTNYLFLSLLAQYTTHVCITLYILLYLIILKISAWNHSDI